MGEIVTEEIAFTYKQAKCEPAKYVRAYHLRLPSESGTIICTT